MAVTSINDLVQVDVSFNGNLIQPKRLIWRGRAISITQVNMVHAHYEGRVKQFVFSVSNATASYKLTLDTETLEWKLLEVYTE